MIMIYLIIRFCVFSKFPMAVFSGLGLIVEEKKASLQTMVDSNKMPIIKEEKSIKISRPIVMIK